MFLNFGISRVAEPANVMPISAWRLDNNREICDNELLISIKKVHIESTNFKQIRIECNNDPEKIKERIIDIVIKRGKFHNPITDTGGIVFGTIEKIGEKYRNDKNFRIGDEVICNTSLAAIPLYISRITKIDFVLGQIEAEGYAVVFNNCPLVKKPEDVPVSLILMAFDESGSLLAVSRHAEGKNSILVIGNNLLTTLLYGYTARRAAGKSARIVCAIDSNSEIGAKNSEIGKLLSSIFDEVYHLNIFRPVECIEVMKNEELFDLCVNCVDIPRAETISVLAAKPKGVVYFTNLIINYYIALYVTEAIPREVEIKCADGFLENYDDFSIQIVRETADCLDAAVRNLTQREARFVPMFYETNDIYNDRKSIADDFICESRVMSAVLDEVLSVSKYDCNVLIIGETGVGKEKIASIIHKNSTRKMEPFIKINCASIADNLLESEFFGYEKGSFTGANISGKQGYFELANNGIIFLDEVGELPMDLQAKLLRVIQDGEFYKVGGTKPIKTNVRVLSATNRDLEKMVEEKRFRRDLYYRLNVFPIRVPPLRERKSEIPALVERFVQKYSEKFGMKKTVAMDAMEYLKEYDWPGNIRELENMVQRLLINTKSDSITSFDVMRDMHHELFNKLSQEKETADLTLPIHLEEIVENYEKEIIRYAAGKYRSSRKAASALNISQTQYIRKKKKYGIE